MDLDLKTPLSFSLLFAKLLAARGLSDPEAVERFIHPDLSGLGDPFLMKGVSEAAARIQRAVHACEKILIHGDYDVDGITGTALVARTLARLKADFSTFLPDRARDGYGVCEEAIRRASQNGFSLLMTVDCGITAQKEIQMARALGLDVIVIDHHRIPNDGLPPATVILNPLQEDCPYPFKEMTAAGLAFKLSQALIGEGAFELLDLAALSTVCDVAPLVGENRLIVKKGLEVLSARRKPWIQALSRSASIKAREMNVGHLGFILGPRINACGRMSSPEISLRLLLTDHLREAESLGKILEEENKMRQKEERRVVKEAFQEVERTFHFNRDRVIVVGRRGWHAGVIGIVASRLVEKFHRPAIVLALGESGLAKGSGRSIKDFHLFQALEACKDLFEEFGGHAQAAGLTMREENVPVFREGVNRYALENFEPEIFAKKIAVDLELELAELASTFIQELKWMEPHGAGNPRPVFLTRNLAVKGKPERLCKGEAAPALHKFFVTDGAFTYEAVWSERNGEWCGLEQGMKLDLIYSVKTKIWEGIESLILEVKNASHSS